MCISRGVHDHVMRKLSCRFEDLGEKSVKNIAQPIRVFRLKCEGGPAALDAQETLTPLWWRRLRSPMCRLLESRPFPPRSTRNRWSWCSGNGSRTARVSAITRRIWVNILMDLRSAGPYAPGREHVKRGRRADFTRRRVEVLFWESCATAIIHHRCVLTWKSIPMVILRCSPNFDSTTRHIVDIKLQIFL